MLASPLLGLVIRGDTYRYTEENRVVLVAAKGGPADRLVCVFTRAGGSSNELRSPDAWLNGWVSLPTVDQLPSTLSSRYLP
jgi:hypothetical protein